MAAARTGRAGCSVRRPAGCLSGSAARPRCLLPALARQPHARAWGAQPAAHSPDGFGDDGPEEWSTDGCERFVLFLEKSEGMAGGRPRDAPPVTLQLDGGVGTAVAARKTERPRSANQQAGTRMGEALNRKGRAEPARTAALRTSDTLAQVTCRRLLVRVQDRRSAQPARAGELSVPSSVPQTTAAMHRSDADGERRWQCMRVPELGAAVCGQHITTQHWSRLVLCIVTTTCRCTTRQTQSQHQQCTRRCAG
jgi:hypothetical protein